MCRSARIQGRPDSGSSSRRRGRCAAELRVGLQLARDGGEALRLGGGPGLLPCARAPRRSRPAGARRLRPAPAGRARPAGRRARRRPPRPRGGGGPSRSERARRSRPPEHRGAGLGGTAGPDADNAAKRVRDPGARRQRLRPQQHRLPAGQLLQQARAARTGSEPEWSSIATSFRFAPGRKGSVSTPRRSGSHRGSARRLPPRSSPRRRRARRSGRAASPVAPAGAGSRAGRARRSSRPRAPSRAGRGRRCSAGRARSRGRRRTGPAGERGAGSRGRRRDAEARAARHGHGGSDRDRLGTVAACERAPARRRGRPGGPTGRAR